MRVTKGFSMLEMLISLSIITTLSLFGLYHLKPLNIEHYIFMNEYLNNQVDAMISKRQNIFNNHHSKDIISFNTLGHINKAQTIKIGNHEIIVHLGNGYLTYA